MDREHQTNTAAVGSNQPTGQYQQADTSTPRQEISEENSEHESSADHNDFDNPSEVETAPIRRSNCVSILPTRLNDYELNIHELMLTCDEEPRSFNEAIAIPEWHKAMKA